MVQKGCHVFFNSPPVASFQSGIKPNPFLLHVDRGKAASHGKSKEKMGKLGFLVLSEAPATIRQNLVG
jgi:hypothetical protein